MRSQGLRNLTTLIDKTSKFHPSPITVAQLIEFGQKRDESLSYGFLHQELPIRISHAVKELEMLPEGLRQQRSVEYVREMYVKTFVELSRFDESEANDEQTLCRFNRQLAEIKRRHATVVETMAEGILALKMDSGARFDPSINYFLDRFYTSRIAIRVLMSNHLILFGPEEECPGHCGIMDPQMDIHDIVDEAASSARFLCNHHYGDCPPIEISTYNSAGERVGDHDVTMVYIASHLHHMVFELVKNGLRATVENPAPCGKLHPVRVLIVNGETDISIRVSDRGGGIPMKLHDHLFGYHYSTAPTPDSNSRIPPLAGFGYGLPLSRLYARYLNGNIRLMSVEGYGTDAVIYLQNYTEEAGEVLPLFNKTSQAKYQMGTMVQDWNVAGPACRPIWS